MFILYFYLKTKYTLIKDKENVYKANTVVFLIVFITNYK